MTDAQTEARAIQRYIAPSAGRGAIVQLLEHCDGEWVRYRDHATALSSLRQEIAAKDAELVEANARAERQWAGWVKEESLRKTAEARLAEANKALEPFAKEAERIDSLFDTPLGKDFHPHSKMHICMGDLRAARRAREQGGE